MVVRGLIGKLTCVSTVMTKDSAKQSATDSEVGSYRPLPANKLSAIFCPTFCALFLVLVFAVSFIGAKLAYERYDTLCSHPRRFDYAKLFIYFPYNANSTLNGKDKS